jgi:hypothetical protein
MLRTIAPAKTTTMGRFILDLLIGGGAMMLRPIKRVCQGRPGRSWSSASRKKQLQLPTKRNASLLGAFQGF